MDDNVIRGRFDAGGKKAQEPDRQVARLREIENASGRNGVGKKGHVLRPSDRIRAARAVGQIVHSARQQGVSVGQIQDALESKGTSGRIDRYMLSPNLDDEEARRRGDKLMAQVRGYLSIADVVATLARRNADELKI